MNNMPKYGSLSKEARWFGETLKNAGWGANGEDLFQKGDFTNLLLKIGVGAGTGAMFGGGLPGAIVGGVLGLGSGLFTPAKRFFGWGEYDPATVQQN